MQETEKLIINYLNEHGETRPADLAWNLKISRTITHRHLKRLTNAGQIEKIGVSPTVYYKIKAPAKKANPNLNPDISDFLQKNYLYVSPSGEMLTGITGFWQWVVKTKQEKQFEFLAQEYAKTRGGADKFIGRNGLVDATEKLKNTFDQIFLDKVYYCDFYSLPKFGKTKLGQMVLYAKQSQNRQLMAKIADQTKNVVLKLIIQNKVSAVSFIPPTVPRQTQFILEYAKLLALPLPDISLTKITRDIIVPQKTLSTLNERVSNIQETLITKKTGKVFENILLIDDAVGSGATFNETAKKLRQAKIATGKIFGFAIVGSYKGFDVIREV